MRCTRQFTYEGLQRIFTTFEHIEKNVIVKKFAFIMKDSIGRSARHSDKRPSRFSLAQLQRKKIGLAGIREMPY